MIFSNFVFSTIAIIRLLVFNLKFQISDIGLFANKMIGGLPWDITKERLEGHFVRFGRIQRVGLKKNEQTGRPRGFAFVIYSKKEDADACLLERWHKLDNHVVDVKKAIPPSEKNKSVLLKPVEQCIKSCIAQSVKKFH